MILKNLLNIVFVYDMKGKSLNYFIKYQNDIIGTIGLRNISSKNSMVRIFG